MSKVNPDEKGGKLARTMVSVGSSALAGAKKGADQAKEAARKTVAQSKAAAEEKINTGAISNHVSSGVYAAAAVSGKAVGAAMATASMAKAAAAPVSPERAVLATAKAVVGIFRLGRIRLSGCVNGANRLSAGSGL